MSNRQDRLYKREKMRLTLKWLTIASMVFITMFLITQIYHYAADSLARYNREIVETKIGSMEQTCQADAIILNDEKAWYAPCEGYFENSVREGERVRIGAEAGFFIPVNGNRMLVQVPITGIYTRHTDSLEQVFANPASIEPGPEIFEYKVRVNKSGHFYKDEPVFKIVNNIKPAEILVRLSETPPRALHKDDTCLLRFKNVDLGKAQIKLVKYLNNNYYLYLRCQEYHELLTKFRNITLTMVFDHKEGIIIPEKALKSKGSIKGVYCIKDEEISFKSVNVIGKDDDMVLVEGLSPNEMVVVNAGE